MIIEQSCKSCSSTSLHNFLVEEADKPIVVFVRCAQCNEFIARYVLSEYYYHPSAYESYVRTHGSQSRESGRSILEDFERLERESIEGYEKLLKDLGES